MAKDISLKKFEEEVRKAYRRNWNFFKKNDKDFPVEFKSEEYFKDEMTKTMKKVKAIKGYYNVPYANQLELIKQILLATEEHLKERISENKTKLIFAKKKKSK